MQCMVVYTGDKGGVGKSTLTALMAEWLLHTGHPVTVIDADPNQTTQTWVDKCRDLGRQISTDHADYTIVDAAGTSGSSLTQYIRRAHIIAVPFKPHVADLEVIVGWFSSVKPALQERVRFIPNMTARTREQRAGMGAICQVVQEEGQGAIVPGLSERKAVYPVLLEGSAVNFFDTLPGMRVRVEADAVFSATLQGFLA